MRGKLSALAVAAVVVLLTFSLVLYPKESL